MNEDLIGKWYQNGPDGDFWKIISVDKEGFVISENKSGERRSAIAEFAKAELV